MVNSIQRPDERDKKGNQREKKKKTKKRKQIPAQNLSAKGPPKKHNYVFLPAHHTIYTFSYRVSTFVVTLMPVLPSLPSASPTGPDISTSKFGGAIATSDSKNV
jgi:hypothetical protein